MSGPSPCCLLYLLLPDLDGCSQTAISYHITPLLAFQVPSWLLPKETSPISSLSILSLWDCSSDRSCAEAVSGVKVVLCAGALSAVPLLQRSGDLQRHPRVHRRICVDDRLRQLHVLLPLQGLLPRPVRLSKSLTYLCFNIPVTPFPTQSRLLRAEKVQVLSVDFLWVGKGSCAVPCSLSRICSRAGNNMPHNKKLAMLSTHLGG